jgi:hypothetical protein
MQALSFFFYTVHKVLAVEVVDTCGQTISMLTIIMFSALACYQALTNEIDGMNEFDIKKKPTNTNDSSI